MQTKYRVILALSLIALLGCDRLKTMPPKIDLHTAVIADNLDAVRQHIMAGTNLNATEPTRQSTPLITAAVFGKTEAATLLIDAGADLNIQNMEGATALHSAAFFCHKEIVDALLKKGADKSIQNKMGKTAFDAVERPFEQMKMIYDMVGGGLKPLGITLDYDHIKATRPLIAAMLK